MDGHVWVAMAELPRISVVTPSLNQGEYLEQTMRSVLDQGYPNLEYFVVDGGSTDGSVSTIRRFADQLAGWVSEPDEGMYDAIRKGFSRCTGDILCWINADDRYMPWTFQTIASVFMQTDARWVMGNPGLWEEGRLHRVRAGAMPTMAVRGGLATPRLYGWVQQESCFWRRELWEAVGGRFPAEFRVAGDFWLWVEFAKRSALSCLDASVGCFHVHDSQLSQRHADRLWEELGAVREGCCAEYRAALRKWQLGRLLWQGFRYFPFRRTMARCALGRDLTTCERIVHRDGRWERVRVPFVPFASLAEQLDGLV